MFLPLFTSCRIIVLISFNKMGGSSLTNVPYIKYAKVLSLSRIISSPDKGRFFSDTFYIPAFLQKNNPIRLVSDWIGFLSGKLFEKSFPKPFQKLLRKNLKGLLYM